jgi:hypothetical protein
VGLLGVAELAIHETSDAGHDQHDCHDPCCAHYIISSSFDASQHESISEALYTPTLNDTNDYHHKRDDQKNVNDSAKCVRGDQPK